MFQALPRRSRLFLVASCLLLSTPFACGKSSDAAGGTTGGTTGGAGGGTTGGATGGQQDTCVTPDAAPAAAAPPACQHTMFAKYKLAGFGAVNQSIIDIALNPNKAGDIGTSFQDKLANASADRKTEFTNNLAAFLITAYGNSTDPDYKAYAGPSMVTAHAGLKITAAQYNKFITEVVVPALNVNMAAADDVSNCFAPQVTDPNFVASIVTCK